jgi:hypothetical protein
MPVAYILIFALIDLCFYPFLPWSEKTLWITFSDTSIIQIFHQAKLLDTLIPLLAFQSLLFLGSIWFKRSKILKTMVAIFILLVFHVTFIFILVKLFGVPSIEPTNNINMSGFGVTTFYNALTMLGFSKIWSIISVTIPCLVAPIGLWVVSFMKMKEQQL